MHFFQVYCLEVNCIYSSFSGSAVSLWSPCGAQIKRALYADHEETPLPEEAASIVLPPRCHQWPLLLCGGTQGVLWACHCTGQTCYPRLRMVVG